ncbi:NAD(P)H-hydrate dehydratase [Roseomonas sp. BN140053]|uniref:NAD(P)H-hydrate dehydratase n=1 Tax=Roseomonas sp. BN140053 TaxID=3391898 RepID=UPI0039E7CEA7
MSGEHPVTPELLRGMPLPQHQDGDDKDGRGSVLVVGGSVEVPGAVLLSGVAALRAGAGRLRLATCRSVAPQLGLLVPEALVMGLPETPDGGIAPEAAAVLLQRCQSSHAILLGPGMSEPEAVEALTAELLRGLDGPFLVLDAAAMTGLLRARDALRPHAGRVVITPHAGEMARLLEISREEVEADPLAAARRAAAQLQVVVAMKGGCTHVVTPQGESWNWAGGGIGLATSGSGDTLAGIIAGLLARGATPVQATLWGVFLHGEAGRRLAHSRGPVGFLARELPGEVPGIMAELGGPPAPGSPAAPSAAAEGGIA